MSGSSQLDSKPGLGFTQVRLSGGVCFQLLVLHLRLTFLCVYTRPSLGLALTLQCNIFTACYSLTCLQQQEGRTIVRPSEGPQVMFLDLAWGGPEGHITYPPFVNRKAVRTVKNPDGRPILRKHDTQQLKETFRRCRQYRQPNTSSQRCAFVHARKCHVCCNVPSMAKLRC